MVPSQEVEARIRAFQERLAGAGFEGAVVVEQTDLYYLAGTTQSAHLVVPSEGEPALLVRRSRERARAESPLERIEPFGSLRDLPRALAEAGVAGGRLGLELDVLPAAQYLGYARRLEGFELADCSVLLRVQRSVKSAWELDRIRVAAAQIADVPEWVADVLREGMTEIELSAEVDRRLRLAGHQGLVRFRGFNQEMSTSSIVAGPSAAVPGAADTPIVGPGPSPAVSKGASPRPIERGEPIVVDLVGAWEGYLADQTRTFSLGPPAEGAEEPYRLAERILREVAADARPGVPPSRLWERAVELAAGPYAERFMGGASFVGHAIGLEIDEWPVLAPGFDEPLEPGVVFALEPKFLLPGRFAVGVENSYAVTPDGVEQLTQAREDLIVV
ncbi:MAG TPA: Xaa-Pro peptidase family protein [Gaiellaceae bacterium]|nr:Xaa-Pro peptidase family protein [Gaiellaceae bacterium]